MTRKSGAGNSEQMFRIAAVFPTPASAVRTPRPGSSMSAWKQSSSWLRLFVWQKKELPAAARGSG